MNRISKIEIQVGQTYIENNGPGKTPTKIDVIGRFVNSYGGSMVKYRTSDSILASNAMVENRFAGPSGVAEHCLRRPSKSRTEQDNEVNFPLTDIADKSESAVIRPGKTPVWRVIGSDVVPDSEIARRIWPDIDRSL